MDLLIDTHVFLWWDSGRGRLDPRAADRIADTRNQVFVSAASVWEIAIKRRKSRLDFKGSIPRAVTASGFIELPFDATDGELAGGLDWNHADPFDRMIVAQTIRHGLLLVTADRAILDYVEVPTLSAA